MVSRLNSGYFSSTTSTDPESANWPRMTVTGMGYPLSRLSVATSWIDSDEGMHGLGLPPAITPHLHHGTEHIPSRLLWVAGKLGKE